MKVKGIALILALGIALGGCGKGKDVQKPLEAPERAPMALDPHPPMSGADIDAIVKQHTRGAGAAAPAASPGNSSDANTKGK